jgi:uncharacterized membrane-anchored protein YhcB (DUF1043 family)
MKIHWSWAFLAFLVGMLAGMILIRYIDTHFHHLS